MIFGNAFLFAKPVVRSRDWFLPKIKTNLWQKSCFIFHCLFFFQYFWIKFFEKKMRVQGMIINKRRTYVCCVYTFPHFPIVPLFLGDGFLVLCTNGKWIINQNVGEKLGTDKYHCWDLKRIYAILIEKVFWFFLSWWWSFLWSKHFIGEILHNW